MHQQLDEARRRAAGADGHQTSASRCTPTSAPSAIERRSTNGDRGYCSATAPLIDAGLVVFAAGVRPRDELARDAGLEMADRGGVLTDLSCVTSDPNIYAIGEVAAVEGRCYGLVAPGYTTAEVVADRLLGGDSRVPRAPTCPPSSSCSASTSRVSVMRRASRRTASRSWSTTR